jgi:hypothetical protein
MTTGVVGAPSRALARSLATISSLDYMCLKLSSLIVGVASLTFYQKLTSDVQKLTSIEHRKQVKGKADTETNDEKCAAATKYVLHFQISALNIGTHKRNEIIEIWVRYFCTVTHILR